MARKKVFRLMRDAVMLLCTDDLVEMIYAAKRRVPDPEELEVAQSVLHGGFEASRA